MTAAHAAAPGQRAQTSGALSRGAGLLGGLLLWVFAGLGMACIAVAVAAFAFGLHLTMFSTGSMSPTIPQGAVALTKNTPADKLRVGDVVTVYRRQKLPITHRIISISAVPGAPAERSIVMKGDANKVPDAKPYVISRGGTVLWSVRGGAKWITRIDNPRVLISASIAAAIVVGWVFWPRRDESDVS